MSLISLRAAEAGDVAVLTEFVKCGVQPDTTSLVLSAYSGRLSFLRFCLEHLHLSLESVDMYGRTALHRACEGSRVAAVRYIVNNSIISINIIPICFIKLHFKNQEIISAYPRLPGSSQILNSKDLDLKS